MLYVVTMCCACVVVVAGGEGERMRRREWAGLCEQGGFTSARSASDIFFSSSPFLSSV